MAEPHTDEVFEYEDVSMHFMSYCFILIQDSVVKPFSFGVFILFSAQQSLSQYTSNPWNN